MFGACYVYVLLRAFQQRNVAFDNYGWILPVSYCMAVVDVFIVAFVAHQGWSVGIVLANGTGGFLGCLSAMFLHNRWVKK
jgi:hypothetical protein